MSFWLPGRVDSTLGGGKEQDGLEHGDHVVGFAVDVALDEEGFLEDQPAHGMNKADNGYLVQTPRGVLAVFYAAQEIGGEVTDGARNSLGPEAK